jgi:DNA-binding NarL/FixJ family response regulator
MTLRILLADDHRILREGLRSLLERQPDMAVVAEADDGRSALDAIQRQPTDVVIMDIAMPGLNGIEATRQIRQRYPDIKVIALSMHSDRRFLIGMLQAGANGFLLKDSASEELITAIRAVREGHAYVSPRITTVLVEDLLRRQAPSAPAPSPLLTPREREVLQLIAEGKSTKEIAEVLRVSVKTVESYRLKIMAKLDLHSVAELTKYAVREGLTTL